MSYLIFSERKKYVWIGFFILIVFISGCSIAEKNTQIDSYVQDKGNISVYFCPADNCSYYLTELIDSADDYVYCSFYDVDLDDVITALNEQSKSIDVRLVVDNNNWENIKKSNISGVKEKPDFSEDVLDFVVTDTSSQYTHNKFCVVDGKKISSGSFNPTENGNTKNNNNLIIIESKYLANNYKDEFLELWNRTFGKGDKVKIPKIRLGNTKIENYFCPEDNCAEHIVDEIMKSKENIYFMTFSFTHDNIADAIALKLNKGVKVKGVFESATNKKYSKFDFLKFQGADVKWDNNKAKMHHKVFIIDNETVITGSMNPSKSGDERNDENILIIHSKDIASQYLEEFEKIWDM